MPDEPEEDDDEGFGDSPVDEDPKEMDNTIDPADIDITYENGEKLTIDTEQPTVFRIFSDDEKSFETSIPQKFEKAYLETLDREKNGSV